VNRHYSTVEPDSGQDIAPISASAFNPWRNTEEL
jgi:hypothetical protein